jgi:hypothetical protein
MRPFFRTFAIQVLGLGKQYYQRSENPEVRARATIAYMNQFHKQVIPLRLFANRAMRDCIMMPEYKIHQEAALIYKDFILEFFKESQFLELKEHLDRQAADSCEYPLRAKTIYALVNELGLNDPPPVI